MRTVLFGNYKFWSVTLEKKNLKKKTKEQLLFVILFTLTNIFVYATGQNGDNVYTVRCSITDELVTQEPESDPIGNRIPSRPIFITVSQEQGIDIPGTDKEDIVQYSIYNEDGQCACSTSEESLFIEMLFSLSGTFEINIDTNEFSLKGWIQIN